jgi:hypothetical protein
MFGGVAEHIGGPSKSVSTDAAAQTGSSSKGWIKGVDDYRDGFYEPMGYHTGGGGVYLHGDIWGKPEMRRHIWDYCPEVKMTLGMDAARYVPGECSTHWKRDMDSSVLDGRQWDEGEWTEEELMDSVFERLVPW